MTHPQGEFLQTQLAVVVEDEVVCSIQFEFGCPVPGQSCSQFLAALNNGSELMLPRRPWPLLHLAEGLWLFRVLGEGGILSGNRVQRGDQFQLPRNELPVVFGKTQETLNFRLVVECFPITQLFDRLEVGFHTFRGKSVVQFPDCRFHTVTLIHSQFESGFTQALKNLTQTNHKIFKRLGGYEDFVNVRHHHAGYDLGHCCLRYYPCFKTDQDLNNLHSRWLTLIR